MTRAPAASSRPDEGGVSPIIGTMFVFVIIVVGMSGGLVFGVPAIKDLQDRATLGDMATQLEQVREEAERLTVEGAGGGIMLAPSSGSLSLENGTRMAIQMSYNGTSSQQGLALAWGKGGKKKNVANLDPQTCDFHLKDWEDGDHILTMAAPDCKVPMRWDPSDGGSGVHRTQTLLPDGVATATNWLSADSTTLASQDVAAATYSYGLTQPADDLRVEVGSPPYMVDSILGVVVKAYVKASGGNDAYKLKVCLASDCSVDNTRQGSQASYDVIAYNVTNKHPLGNSQEWSWSDIAAIRPGLQLEQQGTRDGTWSVDQIWVEVTSGPDATNGNNQDKCFNTSGSACLQAFPLGESGTTNYVGTILAGADETYTLTLLDGAGNPAPLSGDWYFQMSNDPRVGDQDTLLAKAYILETDQLRWVRDEGLTTWLEGGAVFGTRLGTDYLIDDPLVDEKIIDNADESYCRDNAEAPKCQPTYYLRLIRFGGDHQAISAGAGGVEVHLRHVGTHQTVNDGVAGIRFDFDGEGAGPWCEALVSREPPSGYAYADDDEMPCDGSEGNAVRGLRYGYDVQCDANLSVTACAQYLRDAANWQFFQVVFTEVHFDVKLRP